MDVKEVDIQAFEKALAEKQWMYLATESNHRVTTRIISHINDGITLYFYTNEHSTKAKQMKENPNVALLMDGYFIEAKVTNLGAINHPNNQELKTKYQAKFVGAFSNQDETSSDDGDFYQVDIKEIKQYIFQYMEDIKEEIPVGFCISTFE